MQRGIRVIRGDKSGYLRRRFVAAALVLVVVWASGSAFAMGPNVSFKPTSGNKGSTFEASGMGFMEGEKVLVDWDHPATNLGVLTADQDGVLEGSFTIPSDAPDGLHKVTLAGDKGSAIVNIFTVGKAAQPTEAPPADTPTKKVGGTAILFGVLGLILGFGLGALVARRPSRA